MVTSRAGRAKRGVPAPQRMTLAAYMALPEEKTRCEFLCGWVVREPAPEEPHQRAVGNLYWLLRSHLHRARSGLVYLAPFDVVLSEDHVVQPDLVYVTMARACIIGKRAEGAPDLVVEVVGRYSSRKDRVFRRQLYARHGVRECWLVDPLEQVVEVHTLNRAPDEGAPGRAPAIRLQDGAPGDAPSYYRLHGRFAPGARLDSPLLPGFSPDVAAIFAPGP